MKIVFFTALLSCVTAFSPRHAIIHKVIPMKQSFKQKSILLSTVAPVDTMASVDDNWRELATVGESLANLSTVSIIWRGLIGGIFVGFGGILSASIGFDMGVNPGAPGNGLARFFTGAIGFPLTILLVTITGVGAWTGDVLLASRAAQTKNVRFQDTLRHMILMWLGSMAGAWLVGGFAAGAQLAALKPCLNIAVRKLSLTPLQVFLRAVGAGTLINLAVFMARMNRNMVGKAVAIWFPISAYVMCEFEHVLASFFFFSAANFNGAGLSMAAIAKFLIPSTLGNLVGGALVTGGLIANMRKTAIIQRIPWQTPEPTGNTGTSATPKSALIGQQAPKKYWPPQRVSTYPTRVERVQALSTIAEGAGPQVATTAAAISTVTAVVSEPVLAPPAVSEPVLAPSAVSEPVLAPFAVSEPVRTKYWPPRRATSY